MAANGGCGTNPPKTPPVEDDGTTTPGPDAGDVTPDAGHVIEEPDAGDVIETPDAGDFEEPDAGEVIEEPEQPTEEPDAGEEPEQPTEPDAGNPSEEPDAGQPTEEPDAGQPTEQPDAGPIVEVPPAPVDVIATAVGPRAIDLTWTQTPGATSGYRVFRNGTLVGSPGEPRFEDRAVSPATTYSYTVTARNAVGESVVSATARATTPAENTNGDIVPGALRTHATIQSIGIEWDVTGDTDHDATATVRFRAVGQSAWRDAMPLLRVDMAGQNMMSGSILFLEGGTTYDIVLTLTDPDGGTNTKQLQVKTRAVPALPTGGRTFHVVPGSSGGDGSAGNPFKGIAAASAVARAGDVVLVHAGNYGGRISFGVAGEPGRHIAWKAAGDGDAVFAGIEVKASYLRFEGLRVTAGGGYDYPIGIRTANAPKDVAIVRCTIVENHKAIYLTGGGSDWYIADNVIVGDNAVVDESFSGEGVELNHTAGHVVAHNRISRTADGVSYCDRNCDIHGNDIFDTSDDGIEPDFGFANIRMWGNRLANTGHNGISFQPQQGAPWYVIRNQIIGNSEAALKFRGTDRFVFAHNTIVQWTDMTRKGAQLLTAYSRNNVWISMKGGTIWSFEEGVVDWRTSLDYDGFDWASSTAPFKYGGSTYKDIPTFSTKTGQQRRGLALKRTCFPTLNVPAAPPASVPSQTVTLAIDCPAIDAGVLLPNINDDYMGAGPDLGAFEKGGTPLVFGPR